MTTGALERVRAGLGPGPANVPDRDRSHHCVEPDGAEPHGAEPHGAEPHAAEPYGAEPYGAEPHGAGPARWSPSTPPG